MKLKKTKKKRFFIKVFYFVWWSPLNKNMVNLQCHPWRSSLPEGFLGKGVQKICSKFTGENPCQSVILIKLLCNFINDALRHGSYSVNLLHVSRTPLYKSNYGELLVFLSLKKFTSGSNVLSFITWNLEKKKRIKEFKD